MLKGELILTDPFFFVQPDETSATQFKGILSMDHSVKRDEKDTLFK